MERAPQRVVAALLSQPVGHRPEQSDYTARIQEYARARRARESRVSGDG
jgi:hypothetical protein